MLPNGLMSGRERGRQLRDAIYAAYEKTRNSRRSIRIQPSTLGKPCARASWYALRWADELSQPDGQRLRLFDTGHIQEDRLLADLRRVGAQVMNRDPEDNSKQIAIETLDGHLKGYVDGVGHNIPVAVAEWAPVECKSHNADSFKRLERDGVEVSKPEHYAQLQLYMHELDLRTEGLYAAVNKDTDELYFEFIEYNPVYVERLLYKAERIVFAPHPPEKIHNSPEFYLCKFCNARSVCHRGELPPRSCRTCIECFPTRSKERVEGTAADALWHCALHNKPLTVEEQQRGCDDHHYHPNFVAGQQHDVNADGTEITYVNPDTGAVIYIDRGPRGDVTQDGQHS
jgi:hypothetical protein